MTADENTATPPRQDEEGPGAQVWLVDEDLAPAWLIAREDGTSFVEWKVDGADRFQLVRLRDDGSARVVDEQTVLTELVLPAGTEPPGIGDYVLVATSGGERLANSVLGTGDPEAKADLDDYVRNVWKRFKQVAPQEERPKTPTGEKKVETVKGVKRVTQPFTMSKKPEDILTSGKDADRIWPGSVVQSQGIVKDGSLLFCSIEPEERAELPIVISAIGSGPSVKVPAPAYDNVLDAIKKTVTGKKNTSPNIYFRRTEAYSSMEASLSLGLSGTYGGFAGKLNVEANRKETHNTLVVYLCEQAYSATASWDSVNSLFSDKLTNNRLAHLINNRYIGTENPPVMIASVVYGRILLFTMTSSASETEINAALSASYNGWGATIDTDVKKHYKNILNTSEVQVLSQGGDPSIIKSLLGDGKLTDYFGTPHNMEEYSIIGYVVKELDSTPATMSETANYNKEAWGGGDKILLTIDDYRRDGTSHKKFTVNLEGKDRTATGPAPVTAFLPYPPTKSNGYTAVLFRLPGESSGAGVNLPNIKTKDWFTDGKLTTDATVKLLGVRGQNEEFHYKAELQA
ncbi:thiol-activated cytolysin family protein [Streptomyces eurocidicus]|uniref:Uncharacterized protein n=1 Tax=Streptomyces eurocidicus TaxID=66423 RepID=A0A7W8F540_STREU|nr:thiol-activated cytolysin family protein [Streptomyces eurocidicus]MBB5121714.1 hypothetical protein [Streptomyces eurocidicus]